MALPIMNPWIPIVLLSALVGAAFGFLVHGRKAIWLGAGVPWSGVLAWILYEEYFVPYQGGGASMWPVAVGFAGSAAACVGGTAAVVVRALRRQT
jgi:hypothetical protein